MDAVGMALSGDKKLIRKLNHLKDAVQRRIVRRPLSAALTPILKTARQKVPVKRGYLKKSLGKKVKLYRGGVWGGVGPRTGPEFVFVDDKGRVHIPSNYGPLVEFGTRDKPAKSFLRTARDQNRSTSLGILQRGIKKNVEKEAQKTK